MEFICFKLQRRNLHTASRAIYPRGERFKLQRRNLHPRAELGLKIPPSEFQTPTEKFTQSRKRHLFYGGRVSNSNGEIYTHYGLQGCNRSIVSNSNGEIYTQCSQNFGGCNGVSNSNGEIYTGSAAAPSEFVGGFKLQRRNLHLRIRARAYRRRKFQTPAERIYTLGVVYLVCTGLFQTPAERIYTKLQVDCSKILGCFKLQRREFTQRQKFYFFRL